MNIARFWLPACVLALTTAHSIAPFAASLEELQASGHLHIDSEITPSTGIVPGQRVKLTLEIATDTWFTGGTRIGIPEVPGLIILQTEQFASNASENRDGQSWVIQRWTLDVFPQRAGEFTIGPVPLQIQVNAGEEGNVQGELHSPPQQFSVAIPARLAEVQQWVAAPEFRVSQSFNRALDSLAVGDAFEQEVTFEASDVLAMMLPRYDTGNQPGLAVYPSPPTLENSNNRGQNLASRSIRISYVIEQLGSYLLPTQDYFWWNTQSGELKRLSLPETRIDIAGTVYDQRVPSSPFSISTRQWLLLAVGIGLLAATVLLARRVLPRLPLARWRAQLSQWLHRLRGLFKPALATRLNPGSSAEE
jgi:hypothetical protein